MKKAEFVKLIADKIAKGKWTSHGTEAPLLFASEAGELLEVIADDNAELAALTARLADAEKVIGGLDKLITDAGLELSAYLPDSDQAAFGRLIELLDGPRQRLAQMNARAFLLGAKCEHKNCHAETGDFGRRGVCDDCGEVLP